MPNDQNTYRHASEQTPNILTQKHIRSDFGIIRVGTAAKRPTKGHAQLIFYFATDTFVMSYWDTSSETWKSGSAFT